MRIAFLAPLFLFIISICGCNKKRDGPPPAEPPPNQKPETRNQKLETEWLSLFDGKSLGEWKATDFGGQGEVSVEDGAIILPPGADLTGVTHSGKGIPKVNYEIALEAQRVSGSDFFCGLTFPVNDSHASLILGGWGGSVTGISSLDGEDAARNETSQAVAFKDKQWYRVRMRVEKERLQAWLDDERIVDASTKDRKVGVRMEVDLSRPLGIATWQTTGAVRNIRIRKLRPNEIGKE